MTSPHVHREAGRITVRIVAAHLCASLDVDMGIVVAAAPIFRYMIGWPASRLRMYCDSKGWSMSRVSEPALSGEAQKEKT